MTEFKRTAEISIRLPKQTALPKAAELLSMSHEARKSKMRIELPWQPEPRPHPVLIAVDFAENAGRTTWTIFNTHHSGAKVEWSGTDPDPMKVLIALRDWYERAQSSEAWFRDMPKSRPVVEPPAFDEEIPPEVLAPNAPPNVATQSYPGGAMPSGTHAIPGGAIPSGTHPIPGGAMQSGTHPVPNGSMPSGTYPAASLMPDHSQSVYPMQSGTHIVHPDGLMSSGTQPVYQGPVQPGQPPFPSVGGTPPYGHVQSGYPAAPGYPQQPYLQVPYQQNPYNAPSAPAHWAHGAPAPMTPPVVPGQPLPPEMWAMNTASPQAQKDQLPTGVKLGDLLVAAGVIPTRTLQAALSLQNSKDFGRRMIGEILVTSGALPTKVLDAAVRLQTMARDKSISSQRVTEVLRQINSTNCSIEEALRGGPGAVPRAKADVELESEAKVTKEERNKVSQVMKVIKEADLGSAASVARCESALALLTKSRLLSAETIAAEQAANKNNLVDAVKAMLVKETLDPIMFESAMGCVKLLELNRIEIPQAMIALGMSSRNNTSLKQAIADLAWDIPLDGI